MKKYAYNQITLLQFIFIIYGSQVTGSLFILPHKLAKTAGADGWISILLGWALSSAVSLVIVQIMKRSPEEVLPDLLARYFGKWSGKLIAIVSVIYLSIFTYAILVVQVNMMKAWLLPSTPLYMLVILCILPGYMVVRGGLRIAGRFAALALVLVTFSYLSYAFLLEDCDWLHLFPILQTDWKNIFAGVQHIFSPSLGFELTFIFYPFLQNKQTASIGILIGNTLSTLVMLGITLLCFTFYGLDDILQISEPGLQILRSAGSPIVAIVICFYLLTVTISWLLTMLGTVYYSSWLIGKKDHRGHLNIFILLFILIFIFFTPTIIQMEYIQTFWTNFGIGYAYIFPILFWIYLLLSELVHKNRGKT